jgi:hypothetical protein
MTASAQQRIHHTNHPSTVIDGVLRALEAVASSRSSLLERVHCCLLLLAK